MKEINEKKNNEDTSNKMQRCECSEENHFSFGAANPFCLAGCSSDDDEGDNGGEGPNEDAPVSYVLGSGNTNMPSSGTIIAQYADAPVGSEIQTFGRR